MGGVKKHPCVQKKFRKFKMQFGQCPSTNFKQSSNTFKKPKKFEQQREKEQIIPSINGCQISRQRQGYAEPWQHDAQHIRKFTQFQFKGVIMLIRQDKFHKSPKNN